jgi:hypothetical protein
MSHKKTWQRITKPGQVKTGDKIRFNIGDKKFIETAKQLLDAGKDSEEIIYNIHKNFYLITSMSIKNEGSQKNVEFLGYPDKTSLPAGSTCGDCHHLRRCKNLFGAIEANTSCDFSPSRFVAPRRQMATANFPTGSMGEWVES